jgi:hypothetical protein
MYPCGPVAVEGMINLDFDASGRLVGIEVLGARANLAPELSWRSQANHPSGNGPVVSVFAAHPAADPDASMPTRRAVTSPCLPMVSRQVGA